MIILNFGEYKSNYFSMLKYYSRYKEVIFTKDNIIKNLDFSNNGIKIEFNKI